MQASADTTFKPLQAGYRLLFTRNPLPMLVVGVANQRILDANQSAAECFGYPAHQLTEMRLTDLYFPEDHGRLLECMAGPATAFAQSPRWRNKAAQGRAIDVEINAEDLDLHGTRARMLLVCDLTAPRQSSQDLLEERERLNAIVDASSDAIITVNAQGVVETFNPGAERVFRISRSEMLGQPLSRLLPARFRLSHAVQQAQWLLSSRSPHSVRPRRPLASPSQARPYQPSRRLISAVFMAGPQPANG